ncbi:hypothetical protein RMATCC62417_14224 [Rhizopus microsporus]|nr:hypothetical protein RMATCC62417_14224 [Rhizopus microsporus]
MSSRKENKEDRADKRDKRDKRSRKRDRDDQASTPSENTTPVTSEKTTPEPEVKKRKVIEESDKRSENGDIPDHLLLSNFRISQSTIDNLEKKGIKSLFDIQAATFDTIFDGKDVLARARTGTGKTLAFAIPVVERLALDKDYKERRGRAPRVLVLCPTRDLAKQVCGDFEQVSGNRLKTLPVYGGVPYNEQTSVFREGVDVVVGTPGRILDHIKFGNMKLHDLKFIILDEADEMLDARGFEEDMFNLLSNIQEQKETRDYQTLLFSATVPESVMQTIQRFLKEDYERIDLIGNAKNRTNTNIRHIAMPSSYHARADIIGDVVNVYGRSGLTVIFCATKADANELGAHDKIKQDAAVLHGDIAQASREATMKAFREGKYKCIVSKNEDLVMTEGNEEEEEEEESKIYPDSPAISIPKFASDFSDHYEGSSPQHQWNDMDEKGDAVFYTMHMEKSIIDQDFMAEIATFDDDFDDDDLS